jgi:hypothetical protein
LAHQSNWQVSAKQIATLVIETQVNQARQMTKLIQMNSAVCTNCVAGIEANALQI